MKKSIACVVGVCLIALAATPALADWDPGDGHKMHYPQLPDPTGWDVFADRAQTWPSGFGLVADDWECSESGPVSDIHIWGSWQGDGVDAITDVFVTIYADVPDPDGTGALFSKPGDLLWDRRFLAEDMTVRPYGTGEQGWFIPDAQGAPASYTPNDHSLFHQINIDEIVDPFEQVEGTIYWLGIQVDHADAGALWGWKTTQDHWNDDAVSYDQFPQVWHELHDPLSQESLDMAFVITGESPVPEPASLSLLGLGGLALLRRRRG